MNPSKRKGTCDSCQQTYDEEDLICKGCSKELQDQDFETGFNDGKKEGYKEGYDEGYTKGYKEAIEYACREVERQVNKLEREV